MDLNVLIVGGGIHGAGIFHDLASRRIDGLFLAERQQLAGETSSRTTKLVHGGLRYLEHPFQWGLVREAIRERGVLLRLLPQIVHPLPFVLPVTPHGRPAWLLQAGLRLYDRFARLAGHGMALPPSQRLTRAEVARLAPYLKPALLAEFAGGFLYYDAQMRDDVIVRLVCRAATRLGGTYAEETAVEEVVPIVGGFRVHLRSSQGRQELTTRVIVNAGGPWTNANLLRWGVTPRRRCLLNVGTHLVLAQEAIPAPPAGCAATLLQHADGRVVFFIPWEGRWLLGTTDSRLDGSPERWTPPPGDREYLLSVASSQLAVESPELSVEEIFAGIRTIPLAEPLWVRGRRARSARPPDPWREAPFTSPWYRYETSRGMAALSREAIVEEEPCGLLSVYGGKFTTYRLLSERIGGRVSTLLGLDTISRTTEQTAWFLDELPESSPLLAPRAELRGGRRLPGDHDHGRGRSG